LHDLATNAIKYGALSVPGGDLCIKWSHPADGLLTLHWTENGSSQTRTLTREGFGISVIKKMIYQDGGTHPDWRAERSCARNHPSSG
jgi:two-component sensor histidine kinase